MQIKKNLALVAVAAIVLTSGGTAAVAGSLISSNDIKDDTIKSEDVKDGGIKGRDLADGLLAQVKDGAAGAIGATGAVGATGATGATGAAGKDGAQGPKGEPGAPGQDGKDGKDGVTNLITGAGYTDVWEAGSYGESLSECPEGQYAIGGGYSTFGGYGTNAGYDLGGENLDIQVTVNAPYFAGAYEPVDEAGNFRADQWVVRGFNHGDTDQVVRAWVNCATVN